MRKLCLKLGIVIPLVLFLMSGCNAQPPTSNVTSGNLEFKIEDTSKNALWGAKVVSENQPDGQLKITGLTDSNGVVTFNDIAAGDYQFNISRFDYLPAEVALTVMSGQTQIITINLTPETSPTTSPSATPVRITFTDLLSQPERFKDQFVIIDGYWFDGFEIVVLAERLDASSFAPGNLQPGGAMVWIKGGLSEEVSQLLYLQANNPTGYQAHYGRVELTGKLEYGGMYGHLDSYKYQLTVFESKLLPWISPG